MNNLRQTTRVSCAETKSLERGYVLPFSSFRRSILTINPSAQGSRMPRNKAAPKTDKPKTTGRRRNIRGALSNKLTAGSVQIKCTKGINSKNVNSGRGYASFPSVQRTTVSTATRFSG